MCWVISLYAHFCVGVLPVHHMHAQCLGGQERRSWRHSCKSPWERWEANLAPLEEQLVLLTSEPLSSHQVNA